MKKITFLLNVCLVGGILLLNSCAKDGAIGPVGPTGATGNANVHSYKFSINLTGFTGPLTNGEYSYVFNTSSVMGTNYIDEKDAVLLYLFNTSIGTTDYYSALPFNHYWNNGTAFNQHYFDLGATGAGNILLIKIRNSAGGQPYSSMNGNLNYKMVVVSGMMKRPDINWNDYNVVKEYFKLDN